MARHNNLASLNYEALKECLKAAEMLISYSKQSEPELWGEKDNGCLGYPAAILLFSYIEAIGCIYVNRGNGNSFKVLREPIFDSQPISEYLCRMIYETYRNKLAHNLALPENVFLQVDLNNKTVFNISNTGKNPKEAVNSINLYALLELCKQTFDRLPAAFEEKFRESEPMKFVTNKNLSKSNPPFSVGTNPSGYTSLP